MTPMHRTAPAPRRDAAPSRGRRGAIGWLVVGLLLVPAAVPAEELATFEVRAAGRPAKTWTLASVRKLKLVDFENRQGKKRTAVRLSTLITGSRIPLERVAVVRVTGLGGDATKGPATRGIEGEKGPGETAREFRGENLPQALAGVVLFFNPDRHWTLADLDRPPDRPWDPTRVRKVRVIAVTLREP